MTVAKLTKTALINVAALIFGIGYMIVMYFRRYGVLLAALTGAEMARRAGIGKFPFGPGGLW